MVSKQQSLTMDLGALNGGPRTFNSFQDVIAWNQRERDSWSWLGEIARSERSLQQTWNAFNAQLNAVTSTLNQAGASPNDGQLSQLATVIQSAYSENRVIESMSPRGQFILELRETDSALAASVAAYFVQTGFAPGSPKGFEGAFLGAAFDNGITKKTARSEKASLASMQARWEQTFTSHQEELSQLRGHFQTARTNIENINSMQIEEFQKLLQTSKDELKEVETTYDQKLALQSPVKYWQDEERKHSVQGNRYGLASIVAACLVGIGFVLELHAILRTGDKPEYWKIGALAVLAVLSLWLLRILVRLFLSHFHLKTDAAERSVMVQVYLALLREGSALPEEDRRVIFQALFRPACLFRGSNSFQGINSGSVPDSGQRRLTSLSRVAASRLGHSRLARRSAEQKNSGARAHSYARLAPRYGTS